MAKPAPMDRAILRRLHHPPRYRFRHPFIYLGRWAGVRARRAMNALPPLPLLSLRAGVSRVLRKIAGTAARLRAD